MDTKLKNRRKLGLFLAAVTILGAAFFMIYNYHTIYRKAVSEAQKTYTTSLSDREYLESFLEFSYVLYNQEISSKTGEAKMSQEEIRDAAEVWMEDYEALYPYLDYRIEDGSGAVLGRSTANTGKGLADDSFKEYAFGMVLGLMLVSPILPNAYSVANPDSGISAIMAFGKIPIVGCQGSVLTAIITALIGAKLEKKLRKIMPNALDLIMTPFVVMLVTFLIVILCVGPVMHVVELKLVSIVEALVHLPFGIGGFIIGATYPLLVITGLHHTYTMIETSLLANTGFNPVITLCAMYGFANVGTCLAFFVKSKNTTVRQTSIGAMLSQLFGISEPVLFGIQLRYNLKPLIIMLFTSGLGAASLSLLNIQSNSYGLAVIPSYLMYIYEGRQFLWYLVISICSVVLCFVLTYLFGVPEEAILPEEGMDDGSVLEMEANGEMADEENREHKETMDGNKIIAPVSGKVIPMEEVADPTFAGKVLGDGFAIVPEDSVIKSPINGTVELMYETGHAVGLSTDHGKEILIHIGIDTVAMNGDGFHIIAKTGQNVKCGDPLVEVDFEKIRKAGKSDSVIVIVTSGEKVETRKVEKVKSGISEVAEIA